MYHTRSLAVQDPKTSYMVTWEDLSRLSTNCGVILLFIVFFFGYKAKLHNSGINCNLTFVGQL